MAHYLKVADLVHLAPLKHARLVCGHDNTGNPVRGVNVIEAPDVADWIQSGDVLLTNLYAVDKLRPLDVFIDKLAKRKLSAPTQDEPKLEDGRPEGQVQCRSNVNRDQTTR